MTQNSQFDEAVYNKTLEDPRVSLETVYTSSTGIRITITTASLSAIASLLIIFIIFRSKTKLTSVYHRIMFGMSFYDILQSVAMAITTVPMPKDMIYQQFEGLIVGTDVSCRAQGFLFIFGSMTSTTYNGVLCWYYLFVLHFQLQDEKIKRYIEPFFHVLPIAYGATMASLSWTSDLIHPSPLSPWCGAFTYPYWCTDESDCLHREGFDYERPWALKAASAYFLGFLFATGFISLSIVVISVYLRERRFKNTVNEVTTELDSRKVLKIQVYREDLAVTKSTMRQSLYYVAAMVAIFIVPFIRSISNLNSAESSTAETSAVLQMFHVLLRPSQGLFNLLIFVNHKIWALRRQQKFRMMTFRYLLIFVVLCGEEAQETPLSNLELVRRHDVLNNLNYAFSGEEDSTPSGDLPPIASVAKSKDFGLFSVNDASCFSSRDGLSGFLSTGTNMEGISYATREHRVNDESSWQEDGDLSITISTRSPNSHPLEC
jgi:hypothetical protein